MKITLLPALLFVCVAPLCGPPAGVVAQATKAAGARPAPPPETRPENLVRQFYAWYTSRLNREDFEPLKNRREALKYLTPEFYRRVPRLVRELDADILICAQDWEPSWSKNIEISPAAIRGARASTDVIFRLGGTDTLKIRVELRRVGAVWRIDGSRCVE